MVKVSLLSIKNYFTVIKFSKFLTLNVLVFICLLLTPDSDQAVSPLPLNFKIFH